jgi:4-amino-4-deoxy-L-arabinose transferase-like glycosyltransferase
MRVLIAGTPHDPLSPAEEKDVRQFGAEESVQGVVLPADEASKAQASKIKLVLMIFWGIIAIIAAIIASMATPADLPAVFTAAVIAVAALGLFFAFMVWRRTRSWQRDLPRRLTGMAPAGTAIGVDAAGVAVGGQIFPWPTLSIEQVEMLKLGAKYRTLFTLERLVLVGPDGTIVLDPVLMRNGHRIIGNAWRRMRLAGHDASV